MKLYSKEKLILPKLKIKDLTFNSVSIKEYNKKIKKVELNYISKDNYDFDSDYILIYKDKELLGLLKGETIKNPELKPYADKGQELYFVKELDYKNEEIFMIIYEYLKLLARARGISYILFNNENKKYLKFYNFLKSIEGVNELDNYLFCNANGEIKPEIEGNIEIRNAYIGEQYDIGKQAVLEMEDNETNLAYLEDPNLKYTYSMNYLVIYDNSINYYLGYLIFEIIRVTDTKTYNCCFIKDLFIDIQDETKYQLMDKLINYLSKICKHNGCEYIKIKINKDERYKIFYEYCKNNLKMKVKEGFLTKKIGGL